MVIRSIAGLECVSPEITQAADAYDAARNDNVATAIATWLFASDPEKRPRYANRFVRYGAQQANILQLDVWQTASQSFYRLDARPLDPPSKAKH